MELVGLATARGRPCSPRRPRRRRRRRSARSRASWPARRPHACRRGRPEPEGCATPRQSFAVVPGGSSAVAAPSGGRRVAVRRLGRRPVVPSAVEAQADQHEDRDADHHGHDEHVGDVVDRRHHPRRVDEVDHVTDGEAGFAEAARSVRFPSTPPSRSPSATAQSRERTRVAASHTMITATTVSAIVKIHVTPSPSENAAPGFGRGRRSGSRRSPGPAARAAGSRGRGTS